MLISARRTVRNALHDALVLPFARVIYVLAFAGFDGLKYVHCVYRVTQTKKLTAATFVPTESSVHQLSLDINFPLNFGSNISHARVKSALPIINHSTSTVRRKYLKLYFGGRQDFSKGTNLWY